MIDTEVVGTYASRRFQDTTARDGYVFAVGRAGLSVLALPELYYRVLLPRVELLR